MRKPTERIRDMLEAIERIDRYASRGREPFEHDELIQNWVVHHLEIVGEAARSLPDEIRAQAPDIPWADIIGMRNILVHDYFGIDERIVWAVVERDLPPLRKALEQLLERCAK